MMRQANAAAMVVASLLFLPGRLVEEGIHVLAAFPFATGINVRIEPESGAAYTRVDFRAGTPSWAVRLAYVLPELLAAAGGVLLIAWWLVGGALWLPATRLDWLLLALVGAQYLAIALPSGRDMDQTAEVSG